VSGVCVCVCGCVCVCVVACVCVCVFVCVCVCASEAIKGGQIYCPADGSYACQMASVGWRPL
jgi:hypothetical protein